MIVHHLRRGKLLESIFILRSNGEPAPPGLFENTSLNFGGLGFKQLSVKWKRIVVLLSMDCTTIHHIFRVSLNDVAKETLRHRHHRLQYSVMFQVLWWLGLGCVLTDGSISYQARGSRSILLLFSLLSRLRSLPRCLVLLLRCLGREPTRNSGSSPGDHLMWFHRGGTVNLFHAE